MNAEQLKKAWQVERARIAALSRDRQPDDPELIEARRNMRALRLEEHVREVLNGEPALTLQQRRRIVQLVWQEGWDTDEIRRGVEYGFEMTK